MLWSLSGRLESRRVSLCVSGKMESEWPEYPAATALLSDRLTAVHSYSAERCRLWKESGLFTYAWMN